MVVLQTNIENVNLSNFSTPSKVAIRIVVLIAHVATVSLCLYIQADYPQRKKKQETRKCTAF